MSKKSNQNKPSTKPSVEGEGSYVATKQYNDAVKRSVNAGTSATLGKAAQAALEGPEGEALRKAEQSAKRGPTSRGH